MNAPMKVGVLGAGKVARHHARVVAALGHRVTAGSTRRDDSPNWAAFREAAPEARFVARPEEMLEDAELDALVVCLPWNVLPTWTPRLLASEKTILIEKPLALDSPSLERALSEAKEHTANKLIGLNRRFYAPVRRLAERIAEGGLAAVQVTISEELDRHLRAHGAEILPHLPVFSSTHSLDLILHLFGRPSLVRVYRRKEIRHGHAFTSVNGLLETPDGVPITLALNASDPVAAGIRCIFDDHTSWHLSPLETLRIYDRYEIREVEHGTNIRRYLPHCAEEITEPADYKPGFLAQMAAFLAGDFGPGARPQECVSLLQFTEELMTHA